MEERSHPAQTSRAGTTHAAASTFASAWRRAHLTVDERIARGRIPGVIQRNRENTSRPGIGRRSQEGMWRGRGHVLDNQATNIDGIHSDIGLVAGVNHRCQF